MFDAKKLMDQFLGAGSSGGSAGGSLRDTLGTVLGQFGQGTSQEQTKAGSVSGQAAKMSPAELAQAAKGYVSGNAGSLATGALAGGLMALVLGTKTGRKLGGTALQLGGLAALGGLAYKAWSDYQAGRPPLGLGGGSTTTSMPSSNGPVLLPAPAGSGFGSDGVALVALEAMVAAAKADGHIDDKERARIVGELGAVGAESEARRFLEAELAKPLDIDALAAKATTPELATQIYAASLLAIDPDTDVERAYLATLAEKLRLDGGLKAHLETTVAQAKLA